MESIILYFGNELIPEDKIAIDIVEEISGRLPDIEAVHCQSPEEVTRYKDYHEVFIVDVSPDVDDVVVVESLKSLKKRELFSLHDFDLNFFLRLMDKLGGLGNIKIIALPEKGERKVLVEKLYNTIKDTISQGC
jgi:Ni,Fe-hydrogenase maturation factor